MIVDPKARVGFDAFFFHLGMFSEAISNGFFVDTTPPKFAQELTHVKIGSAVTGTSVVRSVLKVEWQVEDKESFIDQQYLSISAHIGGEFNLSSVRVGIAYG